MNYKLLQLSIIFLLLFVKAVHPQKIYFVMQKGNDNADGLSINNAFATLQHAANIVSAGDSVYVASGNYQGFDLRTGGTKNLPITFKAMDTNVVINEPNSVTSDGINIEGADWIIIDGFKVMDQPRAGIRIAVSDNVIIRNNVCIQNYRWGIFTGFTNDILIENNICCYSSQEHGIYVSNSGDRPTVKHNISYGNNGCGIQLNADESQGGDGIITNAVIEGNIIYDNGKGGGAAINLDGVQDSYILNNLLYNNHSTGIALFKIDGADGSKNNCIYNNTIDNPSDARWAVLIADNSTGNKLYNNILINHHSFRGSIAIDGSSISDFTSDFNLLADRLSNDDGDSNMSLFQWQKLGFDLHSLIALPEEELFINYGAEDFHLKFNSQTVDAGTSIAGSVVKDDLDGNPRPSGKDFDIGAYEFTVPLGITNNVLPSGFELYQNYPNPFNPSTKIKFKIPGSLSPVKIEGDYVTLKVYNILGEEIAELVNERKMPGTYEVEFPGSRMKNKDTLPSGIYIYRLKWDNFVSSKKLILLK
jgi:hypothetical protein